MISAILLIIITIFLPPVGVFLVAGCGADLLINICLTILGFFPGHIHAFYVEYIYYHRKEQAERGVFDDGPAPGIFSKKVQTGGNRNYGTVAPAQQGVPPPQQGYYDAPPPQQQAHYDVGGSRGAAPDAAPPAYAKT